MQQVWVTLRSGDKKWKFPLVPNGVIPSRYGGEIKKNSNGRNNQSEKTSIPSSGKYCLHCHEKVGNGNPFRENIYDGNGKESGRKHSYCPSPKILTVARNKNTELRETANI